MMEDGWNINGGWFGLTNRVVEDMELNSVKSIRNRKEIRRFIERSSTSSIVPLV